MVHKIGFTAERHEGHIGGDTSAAAVSRWVAMPCKSVAKVHFEDRNMTLSYYNDRFNLQRGDMVYVEGKMAGLRGIVVDVSRNFKIKLSEYKRVIEVVNTSVRGQFHFSLSHFITFDREALPKEKALPWFLPPAAEDEEFVCGSDGFEFPLNDLSEMGMSPAVAERGHDYYMENKVRYLCLDGIHGLAVVEGSEAYVVEFTYANGMVCNLSCTCLCGGVCKHEVAAMMQFRETLDHIMEHYSDLYSHSDYFAAVNKGTLFAYSISRKETGCMTL